MIKIVGYRREFYPPDKGRSFKCWHRWNYLTYHGHIPPIYCGDWCDNVNLQLCAIK